MGSRDEEIVRLLADPATRAVMAVLGESGRELSVIDLAGRLVAEDGYADRSPEDDDALERTVLELHHNHLPRLDEAGLIRYSPDDKVVTRRRHSGVDAEWVGMEALDELRSRFQRGGGADGGSVGLLEGRSAVYEYGRQLADDASDELFLIYASDELLDAECLPHAESAIERGVEFYAGAKSRDAREFFRDCLPEATVWDPQLDWMYERSAFPKVSRLIVADREHVVVGLWERDGSGRRSEVAMVGEGVNNPLVVLTRELLGPRLDHLDYQSDEFLGDLPFEV